MTIFDRIRPWLPVQRWREQPPRVNIVRLSGVIGSTGGFRPGLTLETMAPLLARAFAPKGLSAVALLVNSPGGSPVQSSLIAGRIRQLSDEKKVPVIAFVEDVAASGGYWLACAADEIFADESSIVGSVGVISQSFGLHEAIGRLGIERRVYTAGTRKSVLDPFRPEEPEDVALVRAIQADIHDAFKRHVRSRRGDRLKGTDDHLFSGAFWTGRAGLDLGLIDGIGDVRSVLRGRFGEKVAVRVIAAERGWRLLRGFPFGGRIETMAQDAVAGALAAVDERAVWSRYGL
jgi:signal peptide peptidase SppA